VARSSSIEDTRPGAYGLAISSNADLPGLDAPSGSERTVRHRVVSTATLASAAGTRRRLLGGAGDGAERIEYEQCGGGAILIRGGPFGEHLVTGTGAEVLSAVEGADPALWPGHVLGQALPLAASLNGLEVFHAGAIAVPGGVVALAGPSGVGKSTLVAALLAAGADFFADDVLAVEAQNGRLLAYPGTTTLGIPREPSGKSVVTVRGERRRLPVLGFLRLDPEPEAAGVELRQCRAYRVMETTFDGISSAPRRPLRLLDVGWALAAIAHELCFPPRTDPELIAAAVMARFGGAPAGRVAAAR
jgi:hypothetical protein